MAFTLRLPKQIEHQLAVIAKEQGVPKSFIIRSILDLYLHAYDKQKKDVQDTLDGIMQLELDLATNRKKERWSLKSFFANKH